MRFVAFVMLMITTASCAGEEVVLEPVVPTIPISTTTTTTTTVTPRATGVTVPRRFFIPPTTTSPPPDKSIALEPLAGVPTPDGLPASFIAVRTNYAVVEIDTASGREVRTLVPPPRVPPETTENYIGKAWWHRSSGRMVLDEGPEPAYGNIWHLPIGADIDTIREKTNNQEAGFRWGIGINAALSPNGAYVFHTGAFSYIAEHGTRRDSISTDRLDPTSSYTTPTWLRDRVGVAMSVTSIENGVTRYDLDILEFDGFGKIVDRTTLPLSGPLAGLATRADGKLVALHADDPARSWKGSKAVVLDPDSGEIIAEFRLEPDSSAMGYDPTGTYLIYVDGTGTVRWQGVGRSGILADGLIHADW